MKTYAQHLLRLSLLIMTLFCASQSSKAEYMRHIVVAADGSGDFATVTEALEAIRAYMDYRVTVEIRNGVYNEKVVIPSWLENVDFIGESAEGVIITNGDYASLRNMGTFRTYTVRVDGHGLTFSNITFENSAGRVGQAVALHTEGDSLNFRNCRLLGNQDTLFAGGRGTTVKFEDCYIEGTTDFIFGGATVLFDNCQIHSKSNSYITAASTPKEVAEGFVFRNCRLTAAPDVTKVYLGRPWRPYAATAFIDCELGDHITPAGWDNWRNPDNESTARYSERGSKGPGAAKAARVSWAGE